MGPKILNDDQKQQCVEVCSEFIAADHRHFLAMIYSFVIMDESMMCYNTPQIKKAVPALD
jgi:hypothetical protein